MHVWEPVGRVDGQTVLCERCATVLANINGYDLDDEERFGVITSWDTTPRTCSG